MYDVIIVGSGGAALSSAISLKQKGYSVAIVNKTTNTASPTAQAQGGINAVLNSNDSIQSHINDTIKSSFNIGNNSNIKYMCENAKDTIKWLDDLGVPFSRDENNDIAQRQMGGASFKRACYSSDYTGLKILHTLFDKALHIGIKFYEEHMLLNIIKNNNKAIGVSVLDINSSNVKQILAKAVILATGGYGGVYHNFTTNSSSSTGDGQIAALNALCELENMEFVQFHPTALKDKFILISESARGDGGYLVTKDGKRFVDELKPRDVVAREIYTKILNKQDVFLDLRHLGYEKIISLMPQEYKLCLDFTSLKMDKDLIPIIPASHYTMGGIKVDDTSSTNINSLYAIGEVSCNGVHGANRLGGNSLLEIITFGLKTADDILINKDEIIDNKEYDIYLNDKEKINKLFLKNPKDDFYKIKDEIGKLMFNNVGLFRNEKSLNEALNIINNHIINIENFGIFDKDKNYNSNLKEYLEFENILKISKVIIKSALARKESRGSHYRDDYKDTLNSFDKQTLFTLGELDD